MKNFLSTFGKFVIAFAMLGAMALTLSQNASAAPTSNPYMWVNSTADTNGADQVLTLREALLIAYHGTDPGYGMHKLTDKERSLINGCSWDGYTDNWVIDGGCGTQGNESIYFALQNCPCTIAPSTPLPSLPKFSTIDGYYGMPGAAKNTSATGDNAKIKVLIYGGYLGANVNGLELGYQNTVTGLEIYGFNGAGIKATSGSATIVGNVIDDNGQDGIALYGTLNHIGSNALGDRNSIYENAWHGIEAFGSSNANQIVNNLIGVPPDSDKGSGNTYSGLSLYSSSNYIMKNIIAYNGEDGIVDLAGLHNNFYNNSIHDNYLMAVDLGNNGVTPNDGTQMDADTGANNLQNYPVLNKAIASTDIVKGKLTSKPNASFQIDFFNSPSCDGNHYGEGQTHLSSITVNTNGVGVAKFTVKLTNFKVGNAITAVASGSEGTSEFSKCAIAQ